MPYWSACKCIRDAVERSAEHDRQIAEYSERDRNARVSRELGLDRVSNFTLDRFDRSLLAEDGYHPLDIAREWLQSIEQRDCAQDYADGPINTLYFYSEGRGRGKTHLASAIALAAYAQGKLCSFIEETSYLSGFWASSFEARERSQSLIGDHCWLTVIDDLGQSPPNNPERRSGAQTAWYDIINRRYMKRGWTIITSNHTLDELEQQGTITLATYSRLSQMTRRSMVLFDGADYRLIDM